LGLKEINMKHCKKCDTSKPLSEFHNHRNRPDGKHIYCKPCHLSMTKPKTPEQASRDSKKYRDKNIEKCRENFRNYYYENKEDLKKRRAEALQTEKYQTRIKAWRLKNAERLNALRRIRRKNMSPKQKAEKAVRDRFNKVIIKMKSGVKYESPLSILGCSVDFLKLHIEAQFVEGMDWSNHGNGEGKWNIDHIIPLVNFDLNDFEQQKIAFNYKNMRPIWFYENMKRKRKHTEQEINTKKQELCL
jgi:hypothetical protein